MAATTEVEPTMDAPTTTLTPEELQKKLDHLKASATQQYSLKNYSAAAEFYSEAAETQDLINGEMSPENADLLYQYGRCLYHVGVSNSDVLGGKVAGTGAEEPKKKKRKTAPAPVAESSAAGAANGAIAEAMKKGEDMGEEVVKAAVGENEEDVKTEEKATGGRPFFQITGDENWTDSEGSDDEDGEGEAEGEEEEDDDDFAIAYEILDIARVLLERKLALITNDRIKNTPAPLPDVRQLKERLADTHDLQAEIKLENEQFADAVVDARAALGFKAQLYPEESGLVAEAHYKLAIALDFASLPASTAEEENAEQEQQKPKEEPKVNEEMRAEAATEMENAIKSCQLRIAKEEAALSAAGDSAKQEAKRSIADVKSMVAEMKNRLVDLRNPAEPQTLAATGPVPDGADPLRGVLGAMLGESKAEQAKLIQQATSQANDLSGLVKKRKAPKAEEEVEGKGKGKKAKVEGE